MANVNRPHGLAPVRHINGSPWNGQVEHFSVLASDNTALFVGDAVISAGTADATGRQCITRAANTSTARVIGVIVGFDADPTNLNRPSQYRLASTARTALVCVDPTVLYEIQADGTTANAAAAVGLNAPLVLTAGSTITGISAMELNIDAAATNTTLPLKIVGAVQTPDNDYTETTNVKYLVLLNTSTLNTGTEGV